MIRYKILVVLYNRLPSESETLQSLIDMKESIADYSDVIVWDNSTVPLNPEGQRELAYMMSPYRIEYKGTGENCYLSVIYNKIINVLDPEEYLIIFDQDSTVKVDYFSALNQAICENPSIDLFLPVIVSKKNIVSPSDFYYFKGSYWKKKKTGIIQSKHITAINSGMAISGMYLTTTFPGYDENLKFYGTDNDFMNKYFKSHKTVFVLDVEVEHILDFYEQTNVEDKIRRYRAMREGALINAESRGMIVYLLAKLYLVVFSIKLAVVHKDFRFVK